MRESSLKHTGKGGDSTLVTKHAAQRGCTVVGYVDHPSRSGNKITPRSTERYSQRTFQEKYTIISSQELTEYTFLLANVKQDIYTQQSYVYLRSNDNKQLIGITIVTSKKDSW